MRLTSTAFEDGGQIPAKYTCDGADISPPLEITQVPPEAESLALVMDDPDAPGGTFDHWVVWNISPDTEAIPEDSEPDGEEGKTDFGRLGYGGPCPPSGAHTYRFKLYALDSMLDLQKGASKAELQEAMEGHIVAQDEIDADYSRG